MIGKESKRESDNLLSQPITKACLFPPKHLILHYADDLMLSTGKPVEFSDVLLNFYQAFFNLTVRYINKNKADTLINFGQQLKPTIKI